MKGAIAFANAQAQWNSVNVSQSCNTQPGINQASAHRCKYQQFTSHAHLQMIPYSNRC